MLVGSGADGVSITLTKIKYRTPVPPFSGTATLEVAPTTPKQGRSLGQANSVSVSFTDLRVDNSNLATAGVIALLGPLGNLQVSGGPVTDQSGKCGTDLILESEAKITKTAPGEVRATGPMRAELPYRDAKGKRAAFVNFEVARNKAVVVLPKDPKDPKDTLFVLHDTGQLSLHLSGGRGVSERDNFDLAGFNFKPEILDLDIPSGGLPSTLTVSIPSGFIQSPLPYLITQDDKPLPLKASGIEINASGQPSFSKAAISNTFVDPEILLVKPIDFGLSVHQAVVSVKDGAITDFKLTVADLILPEQLNQYPTPSSVKLSLPQIDLLKPQTLGRIDLTPGPPPIRIPGQPPKPGPATTVRLNFAKDAPKPPPIRIPGKPAKPVKGPVEHVLEADLKTGGVFLDLSSEGPANADKSEPGAGGAAWQGLFFPSAVVDSIPATNFFADGFGITGVAKAGDREIDSYDGGQYSLQKVVGGETFRRSELVSGGGYTGTLIFPAPAPPLTVRGSFCGGRDPTVVVDPQDVTTTVHTMHLSIGAGTLDSGKLTLAGTLDFPDGAKLTDAGAAFVFQDVPVNSAGNLDPPNGVLQFSHPMEVDVGSFKLQVTGISDFDKPNLRLQGGMDLASDLPVANSEQFQGIPIGPDGKINTDQFKTEKFHLDVPLAGVGRIVGDLNYVQGDTTSDPSTYLGGDVSFQLAGDAGDGSGGENTDPDPPAPPSGGKDPAARLQFRVGDGAWFARGIVNTHPFGIVLPIASTGLYLRGFNGAIGHNVKIDPPDPVTGKVKFDSIKLDRAANNWFFSAGVRVASGSGGDPSEQSVWLDVLLTVVTDPLLIDLQGDIYVSEEFIESGRLGGDVPEHPSRHGSVAVLYDSSTQSFRAAAVADVYLPSYSAPLVSGHGSMDFLISPEDKHFYIGWPFPANAVQVRMLDAFGSDGGAAIILEPKAQRGFASGFKWSLSLGPISGEMDGTIGASFDTSILPSEIYAKVHASGEVDFYVFSVNAEATLDATFHPSPVSLYVHGEVRGCIDTFLGDACESVSVGVNLKP